MTPSTARRFCLALLGLGLLTASASAQPPSSQPPDAKAASEEASRGALLYRIHCASCHGKQGEGDGPVAAALVEKPTDLTALARRAGGKFPQARVQAAIDGRTEVSAHGARDMPVWGLSFVESGRDAAREGEIEAEIQALVRHLASLQRP